jgi:hypothetical protein
VFGLTQLSAKGKKIGWEYATWVTELTNGGYSYETPATDGSPFGSNPPQLSPEALRAIVSVHAHPNGVGVKPWELSGQDIAASEQSGKSLYVITPTADVMVYVPSENASRLRCGGSSGTTIVHHAMEWGF